MAKIVKTLLQILVIAIIVIGIVFLSMLPTMTMGEIITEERDGVLYVSNVYPMEMQGKPTLIHDKLVPWQVEEVYVTKDSTLNKTMYDFYMEHKDYYSAGEWDLYVEEKLKKAKEKEVEGKYCGYFGAMGHYKDIGDFENIEHIELICQQQNITKAQKYEADGEFYKAIIYYTNANMFDEVSRVMALEKEKMQNTLPSRLTLTP